LVGNLHSRDACTNRSINVAPVIGEIQAGFGYWFTPNLKVAASYRLDALVNVNNVSDARSTNSLAFSRGLGSFTPSRYTHGPRLTVTDSSEPTRRPR
jgi:hypothetical protein